MREARPQFLRFLRKYQTLRIVAQTATMDTGPALLVAAIVLFVLVISAAFIWYNFMGWTEFSYKTGESPSWQPLGGKDISRLRFKDCVFTVNRSDGKVATLNATPVLNSMAVAYKTGTTETNPTSLTLTRPLNPFSFVITNFNDKHTVPDPTASPWCTTPPPPTCSTDADCPYKGTGSCVYPQIWLTSSNPKFCTTCLGSTVTLSGKMRTI